jgi:3-phenylpropionate/trans-cinnamate dioxygenase ferredoxin reductase subunit
MDQPGIVILGAGQAGLQMAESLRSEKFDGPITLIGAEPGLPYHRPPLSKGVLLGDTSPQQIEIRSAEVLARKAITLRSGVTATAIDRAARTVSLSDGTTLPYRGLGLATGSRPRPLSIPGADLDGVMVLRTLADTLALSSRLDTARKAAIVGGGFIGLETAAALRKRGIAVTVLEAADRLLARVSPPHMAAFFASLHESNGVTVRCAAQAAEILGTDGRVTAIATTDGTLIEADLVVVGIGILPNDDLAKAAGLACEGGIVVDSCARTDDPLIVAAGDCTARRDAETGRLIRLESVQNAVEQAKAAAAALMGHEKPFTATPWFWSDQYDVKLQMAGSSAGHDRMVLRGSVGDRHFSAFYYLGERLIGVDCINRPQDHLAARKLLDRAITVTPTQAEDEGFDLQALLKA